MLETVSHYQMVSPLVHTIQVIASLYTDELENTQI